MSTISSLTSALHATQSVTGTSKPGSSDFGSALKSAVEQVDNYQKQANEGVQQFLQGHGELHNVALATQRAEMAFDLAVQVRNKVVSAYQEIMKMQL